MVEAITGVNSLATPQQGAATPLQGDTPHQGDTLHHAVTLREDTHQLQATPARGGPTLKRNGRS